MAGKKCVLIVGDDADLRMAIREMLRIAGHESLEAADRMEGLTAAASLAPALILLDVRLPDLDGYEVFRQLKANPLTAPIPVVFLTLGEDAALSRFAYQSGAAACLAKPFRLEALLAVIRATLGSAERQRKHRMKAQGSGARPGPQAGTDTSQDPRSQHWKA